MLAAIKKLADGRLCSPGPMQYGIHAALTGDRSHQRDFVAALRERADLTVARLSAIPGMRVVAPHAAFYAMPQVALPPGKTDEDFVLGLLRETGILCVYGSGFGLPADQGFFRVVFLASSGRTRARSTTTWRPSPRVSCPDDAGRTQPRHRAGGHDVHPGHRRCVIGLYLIRDVLLTLYVSGLLAIGLSPAVQRIEHSRLVHGAPPDSALAGASSRLYVAFLLAVALVLALVVPPLVGAGAAAVRRPSRLCGQRSAHAG